MYGAATAPAPAAAPLSSATTQLIVYGLLMGGAAVVGKLMIDGLVGDMSAAKERREFIGPVYDAPIYASQVPKRVKINDAVKFVAMCVSVYSILADLPTLVSEFGQVQATVKELTK